RAERLLANRARVRRVLLESASAPSTALREAVTDLLGGEVWIEEKVRPDLLSGIRVCIDEEILIDASGKRRLAQLFQRT
ncbi:MAG: F0F1 ATP synthase subunit delta, partial [Patescibacteria group bacterium]|nr:F0F1 ATP synthase subunit delta [Patescibacteria group bacterium]